MTELSDQYRHALSRYVHGDAREADRLVSYDEGRSTLASDASLLDLVSAHHRALLEAGLGELVDDELRRLLAAGQDFLAESLVPFEVARRGFAEANRALHEANRALERQLAALQASEERLRLALAAAQMGTWDWDLRTQTLYCSVELEALFGLLPGSLAGTVDTVRAHILEDDWPKLNQLLHGSPDQHGPVLQQLRIVLPNGSVRWLECQGRSRRDPTGAIVGQIGIGMDITDRKTAEDQLYRRSQEFGALVENAPDIIVHFDRELRYLYLNPAAERAIGLPSAALAGTRVGEFGVPESGSHAWVSSLAQVVSSGRDLTSEVPLLTPLGERHYQARFAPEFAPGGTVESVLCIARDITERKRVDDDRSALYRELLNREQRIQDLVRRVLLKDAEDAGPRTPQDAEILERLSRREREILRLVVQGGSNRSIGEALGLSAGTIKNRLGQIYSKLEVADRTQAALRAAALGLTSPGR